MGRPESSGWPISAKRRALNELLFPSWGRVANSAGRLQWRRCSVWTPFAGRRDERRLSSQLLRFRLAAHFYVVNQPSPASAPNAGRWLMT
jgi:hypothetical protein